MNPYKEKLLLEFGFTIDKDGNVYNTKKEKIKGKLRNGYKAVAIREDGKRRDVMFHRFQAYMKYGDKIYEDGIVIRHLNNNKLDNSWDNIDIGSCKDNSMDNPKEMRVKYAINASKQTNKYTKEFVKEIRKKHNEGLTYNEIIKQYGLPKSSISHIINNDYKTHQ